MPGVVQTCPWIAGVQEFPLQRKECVLASSFSVSGVRETV